MHVIKRDGSKEEVQFDKITTRLQVLVQENNLSESLDLQQVTKQVINNMINGMTTVQLDLLAAETCAYYGKEHPEYMNLAGAIEISNLHKNTGIKVTNGQYTVLPKDSFSGIT